jgi:eukaryotic-like serine/threonine-protein kinase
MKADASGLQAPELHSLGDELRALPSGADPLELELSRAAVASKLFGAAQPAKVGRFVLLGPVAAGGMGSVYAAYDPELDRRVALKVLHGEVLATEEAQARLLAEARALARIDHPNVVPVHDALRFGAHVVLVMEWVQGHTLAEWQRAQRRSWREKLDTYLAAGRGLAAAHALGIVHRDFKPHNVIVGRDERVRVLDFGLARLAPDSREPTAEPVAATAELPHGLTAAGERLGTLAFMAPEQLAGVTANAAADQFAFCVALHRALFDVAPYPGVNAEELLVSMRARRMSESPTASGVPSWLRTALVRGLAFEPAARFPSMDALLDELGRDRSWRRWALPSSVAVVMLAVGTTLWVSRATSTEACGAEGAEQALAWRPAVMATALSALSAAGVSARLQTEVRADIESYRRSWQAQHRAACLDHRRGAQSAALLDRRMLCLQRRKDALAGALEAVHRVNAETSTRVREITARLPALEDCSNLEALHAIADPPATAQARRAVEVLRQRLAEAVALEHGGHGELALALVRELRVSTEAVGYPPLGIEIALAEARLLLQRGEYPEAARVLAATEGQALALGLGAAAVEAAARRMYAQAMMGDDLPGLMRQAEVLEPLSRSLRGDAFARPLLLNNLGVVHMARGQRPSAAALFAQAQVALAEVKEPDLELVAIDANLAMVTSEAVAREAAARRAWERRQRRLGDEHPATVEALLALGKYTHDPARALPLVRAACRGYAAHLPSAHKLRLHCAMQQGLLESAQGEHVAAAATYLAASTLAGTSTQSGLFVPEQLAAGFAALERGERVSALDAFARALAASSGQAWWQRTSAAVARLGLATARPAKQAARALAELEAAIPVFEEATRITEDSEHRLYLDRARSRLAEVRGPR